MSGGPACRAHRGARPSDCAGRPKTIPGAACDSLKHAPAFGAAIEGEVVVGDAGLPCGTRACDAVLLLDHRSSLSGCVLASELSRRARSFDSRRSARISDSQLRLTFPLSVIGMRSTYSMRSGQRRFCTLRPFRKSERRSRWDAPRRTRRRTGKCAHRVADRACRWLHGFRCRDIRLPLRPLRRR